MAILYEQRVVRVLPHPIWVATLKIFIFLSTTNEKSIQLFEKFPKQLYTLLLASSHTISAFGLFCIDKYEDNQTRKCSTFFRMSKLTEPYFGVNFHVFRLVF